MIYCISDVGSVNLVCLHLSQEMVVDARHLFTDLSNGVAIDFAEIQTEVNRIANDLSPFYQHKINDLFLYYSIQQNNGCYGEGKLSVFNICINSYLLRYNIVFEGWNTSSYLYVNLFFC